MKKINLLATAFAAAALSVSSGQAAEMEKCKVVGKDGKGLIKEFKGACNTSTHSCAGQNKAGDPEAWILVPEGECAKINAGDTSGVAPSVREKLDLVALAKSTASTDATTTSASVTSALTGAKEKATDAGQGIKEKATDKVSGATDKMHDMKEKVTDKVSGATDKMHDIKEKTTGTSAGAELEAKDNLGTKAADTVRDGINSGADSVKDAIHEGAKDFH